MVYTVFDAFFEQFIVFSFASMWNDCTFALNLRIIPIEEIIVQLFLAKLSMWTQIQMVKLMHAELASVMV